MHALDLADSLGFFIVTPPVFGCVRVVRVKLKRFVFNVDESFPWCSATTSCVLVRARNKLLHRVDLEWTTILKEHGGFNSSSSRESPARRTVALVPNWVDGTLSSPVNTISDIGLIKDLDILFFLEFGFESHDFLELSISPVSKLIKASSVCLRVV